MSEEIDTLGLTAEGCIALLDAGEISCANWFRPT